MNIHFGSKYIDGYHPVYEDLTSEACKSFIPYCATTVTTHTSDPKWADAVGYKVIKPLEIEKFIDLSDFEKNEFSLFCPKTTLKIVLMAKEDSLFITFGAKESYYSETEPKDHAELGSRQFSQITSNILGYLPEVYIKASEFVAKLKNSNFLDTYNTECVGQSFGGSIAQYVGLKHEFQTTIFNSLAIGSGLQLDLNDEAIAKADTLLTHVSIEGDFVSDNSFFNGLDYIASTIGIRTPGNFGVRKRIPSAYDNLGETHGFVLGSLLVHSGFSDAKSPDELKKIMQEYVK